jgi:hypothetical protein
MSIKKKPHLNPLPLPKGGFTWDYVHSQMTDKAEQEKVAPGIDFASG